MAMKKGLKARWVAALRSGKYKQGRGSLQTGEGEFCCLGVLCEISPAVKHRVKAAGQEATLGVVGYTYAGLSREQEDILTSMNDEGSKTFLGIATWIERHL